MEAKKVEAPHPQQLVAELTKRTNDYQAEMNNYSKDLAKKHGLNLISCWVSSNFKIPNSLRDFPVESFKIELSTLGTAEFKR